MGENNFISTDCLNGKVISKNLAANTGNLYIPVFFEVDNTGFMPEGTILEFRLKSTLLDSQIVIPKTAIIENRGKYYVYLQVTGETYTKNEIQIAWEDGKMVQVLSGLHEGDVIVGKGAIYVRAASDKNAIPVHSHSH